MADDELDPAGRMNRTVIDEFPHHLAGLAGPAGRRAALMFFEAVVSAGWLSADEHFDRRRALERAVLALVDDRAAPARVRARAEKLLRLVQDGPPGG